jgi:ribosome maturation factor RimP
MELVDVACVGQGGQMLVRLFIDKPGGVTLDDCERVHQSVGYALDVDDPIPHTYTLEVSSPGLDRPFRRREDYAKRIGQTVRLKLTQPLDGVWRIVGRLEDVNDEGLTLGVPQGKGRHSVSLAWAQIAEGRLEIEI